MMGQLAIHLAVLAIAIAGICMMFKPLRDFGWKLFAAGIVLAAAAAIIPTNFG